MVSRTSWTLRPVAASACGESWIASAGVPLCRLNCRSTMPLTLPRAATTLSPVASSASRSSPNTLMATCAVSPLRLFLIDLRVGFQLDVELAAVRSPGVLAQLGAPDLLIDALHVGEREHFGADAFAEGQHLIERGPGDRARYLQDEVPLAKIRHEGAAQKWQRGHRGHDQSDQHQHHELQVCADALYRLALPHLEGLQPARFRALLVAAQQQSAQRRGRGQCHD